MQASVEAAGLRLPRLILMTSGAIVLGAVPLAIATGAGAESRSQIGWVIVGGISFGTLFTLIVVPTAYTLLARTRHPAARAPAPARTNPCRNSKPPSDHFPRSASPCEESEFGWLQSTATGNPPGSANYRQANMRRCGSGDARRGSAHGNRRC